MHGSGAAGLAHVSNDDVSNLGCYTFGFSPTLEAIIRQEPGFVNVNEGGGAEIVFRDSFRGAKLRAVAMRWPFYLILSGKF